MDTIRVFSINIATFCKVTKILVVIKRVICPLIERKMCFSRVILSHTKLILLSESCEVSNSIMYHGFFSNSQSYSKASQRHVNPEFYILISDEMWQALFFIRENDFVNHQSHTVSKRAGFNCSRHKPLCEKTISLESENQNQNLFISQSSFLRRPYSDPI